MVKVTPAVSIMILLVIIFISVISAIAIKPGTIDTTWWKTFLVSLSGLSIFIIFLFYYSIITLQQTQHNLFVITETSRISDLILDGLIDEIQKSVTIIPDFVESIMPLSHCNNSLKYYNKTDSDNSNILKKSTLTPKKCAYRLTLSYKIFSIWQSTVISQEFVDVDTISYLSNFLQRSNSKLLYDEWLTNRLNFNEKTQQFGDLLFEYGLPINRQVPRSYICAAKKMLDDPRYKKIFDKAI